MNFMWRITKYNPEFRDESGAYLLDEWTSFADIGKDYNGLKLSTSEYERYEKAYIDSILRLMECNQIEKLKIIELEIYEEENVNELINNLKEGMILSKEEIEIVVQHVLREKIWCKLVLDEMFYVHFGYDYNMYIGSNIKCEDAMKDIKDKKMFIESLKSPYSD